MSFEQFCDEIRKQVSSVDEDKAWLIYNEVYLEVAPYDLDKALWEAMSAYC